MPSAFLLRGGSHLTSDIINLEQKEVCLWIIITLMPVPLQRQKKLYPIIKKQAATQEKSCCSNDNATPSAPACCCTRHTDRSEADRKKLINRLKRIEGQIRGIIGMLENDAYCNDILIQSAAVNAAVNSFNKELLANHIRTCVARDIREGKDETIDELVATLQKLMK